MITIHIISYNGGVLAVETSYTQAVCKSLEYKDSDYKGVKLQTFKININNGK